MVTMKCKKCGANIEVEEGKHVAVCKACGAMQVVSLEVSADADDHDSAEPEVSSDAAREETWMDKAEKLAASINRRPTKPAWQILIDSMDKICNTISEAEGTMDALMLKGEYDKMLNYWNGTVGYRQNDFYEDIDSRYHALSKEDKKKVSTKHKQYVKARESFEHTCEAYEKALNNMRDKGTRTSLVAGPIFTAIMAVVIWIIGWNNLFTKFFALCALGLTIEALCEVLIDKLRISIIIIGIIAGVVGAVTWWVFIGLPPVTASIIIGYVLWAGIAFDIGSDSFTIISGE